MSSDINVLTLVGRLTKDVEVKYTKSGTPIAELSIANNGRKKVGENWEDEVSFFDATLFGGRVTGLSQHLLKGKGVAIHGQLKQQRWVNSEGKNRSKVGIRIVDIQLLSSGERQNVAPERQKAAPATPADDFGDDIPF